MQSTKTQIFFGWAIFCKAHTCTKWTPPWEGPSCLTHVGASWNRSSIFSPTHISDPILSLQLWLSSEPGVVALWKHPCPGLLSGSAQYAREAARCRLHCDRPAEQRWDDVCMLSPCCPLLAALSQGASGGVRMFHDKHSGPLLHLFLPHSSQSVQRVRKRTICVLSLDLYTKRYKQDILWRKMLPTKKVSQSLLRSHISKWMPIQTGSYYLRTGKTLSEQHRLISHLFIKRIYMRLDKEASGLIWPQALERAWAWSDEWSVFHHLWVSQD